MTPRQCICGNNYIIENYPEGHCDAGRAFDQLQVEYYLLEARMDLVKEHLEMWSHYYCDGPYAIPEEAEELLKELNE